MATVARAPWLVLVGWLLAFGTWAGCGPDEKGVAKEATPVEVARVDEDTLAELVSGIGQIEAVDTVPIRTEVAGLVERVHFRDGDEADAGALLFTLDDDKLVEDRAARRSALRAARAAAEESTLSLQRVESLHEQTYAPKEELDQTRAAAQQAAAEVQRLEAELRSLEENFEDTRIRAPFSGRLTERQVDPGDYVSVGDPLVTLVQPTALEVQFWVSQRHVAHLREGLEVRIHTASNPQRAIRGEIVFVSPRIDESSRRVSVKAKLDQQPEDVRPGVSATVEVVVRRHTGPVVPERALIGTRDGYIVFIVRDGVAQARPVRVKLREPGRALIADEIEVGQTVVVHGHDRLSDGDPVDVIHGDREAVIARANASRFGAQRRGR